MKLLLLLSLILVAASDPLYLTMSPGFLGPKCGNLSASTVSVQYSPDEFYLSKMCRTFFDVIGGFKAKMPVDMVFLCTSGQTTQGTGSDDNKMKLLFFTGAKGPKISDAVAGTVSVGATMQVTYVPKDLVLAIAVTVTGHWVAAEKAVIFDGMMCE